MTELYLKNLVYYWQIDTNIVDIHKTKCAENRFGIDNNLIINHLFLIVFSLVVGVSLFLDLFYQTKLFWKGILIIYNLEKKYSPKSYYYLFYLMLTLHILFLKNQTKLV